MNNQQAQKLLGLNGNESTTEITAAYQSKIKLVEEKLTSAPTDALKQKLNQMKQALEQAHQLLNVTPKAPTSPLSQTKMADLPGAAPQMGTEVNLQTGQILAGRYEIKEQIGAGGMGAVYHAFDQTRGQDVALKVLLPHLAQSQRAKERFLNEARLSSQLSHPNIVNVYDMQQDGDYAFLSMELLDGQDLRHLMESRLLMRQDFTEAEAKELAKQMCEALNYAHKHTVHRDIKPENIWVTEEGDFKLMDFGIARVMSSTQRTQTGMSMGTAYYMAPEQLKGTSKIDGRADIYALGVLLYELLSGDVPAGRFKPLRELRKDLNKKFANAVDKALETSADDRYANANEFYEALNGKGANLSLPSVRMGKSGKIAAGLLIVAIALSALIFSSDKPILDTLASWMPESSEVVKARQMKVVKLEGEAKTLRKELEEFKKSFKFNLKDKASDLNRAQISLRVARNSTEKRTINNEISTLENSIAKLEKEQNFANQYIIPSNNAEMNGNFSMLESLLRDKDYKNSLKVLEPLHQELSKRIDSIQYLENAMKSKQVLNEQWKSLKKKFYPRRKSMSANDKICDDSYFVSSQGSNLNFLFKRGYRECLKSKQIFKILKFRMGEAIDILNSGELKHYAFMSKLLISNIKRTQIYRYSAIKSDNEFNNVLFVNSYAANYAFSTTWQLYRSGLIPESFNEEDALRFLQDDNKILRHLKFRNELIKELGFTVSPGVQVGFSSINEFDVALRLSLKGNRFARNYFLENLDVGFKSGAVSRHNTEQINSAILKVAESALLSNDFHTIYKHAWLLLGVDELNENQAKLYSSLLIRYKDRFESESKKEELKNNKLALHLLDFFQWNAEAKMFDDLSRKEFSKNVGLMERLDSLRANKKSLELNKWTYFRTAGWAIEDWDLISLIHFQLGKNQIKPAFNILNSLASACLSDNLDASYFENYRNELSQEVEFTKYQIDCNKELVSDATLLSAANRHNFLFSMYKPVTGGITSWSSRYNYSTQLLKEIEKISIDADKNNNLTATRFLINLYTAEKNDVPLFNGDFFNLKKAFELKLEKAKANYTSFYYDAAMAYEYGTGVKKDKKKFIYWQKKFVELKPNSGDYDRLASDLLFEKSVQDYSQALKYYKKAIAIMKDDEEGKYTLNNLGYMYFHGKGVKRNRVKAHAYFLRAARAGYKRSMDWVINNYKHGRGVKADVAQVKYWEDIKLKSKSRY